LEQGQVNGRKAAASTKTCLVNPHKLQVEGRIRDLAMFNVAIDNKLRGCDVVNRLRFCRCSSRIQEFTASFSE
jgi:hypothetical protein